jgi:hypothetical protein
MRHFVFARHAESSLNSPRLASGDPPRPSGESLDDPARRSCRCE